MDILMFYHEGNNVKELFNAFCHDMWHTNSTGAYSDIGFCFSEGSRTLTQWRSSIRNAHHICLMDLLDGKVRNQHW